MKMRGQSSTIVQRKFGDQPQNSSKKYTWDEVHNHRSTDDCWFVVKGKVYDVTSWVPKHPGGKIIMNGAGRDATPMFMSYHPLYVQSYLSKYEIGEIEDYKPYYNWDSEFYKTVKSRVDDFLKKNHIQNDSYTMYMKSLLLVIAWFVLYYYTVILGNVWLCFIFGYVHSHFGISVAHDGLHGAYSKRPFFRIFAARAMDLMGGSSISWVVQHNIGHHPNSNRQGGYYHQDFDPDTTSGYPYVRITPHHKWLPHHRYQHYYIWLLLGAVGFKWFIADIKTVLRKRYNTLEFFHISSTDFFLSFFFKGLFLFYMGFMPSYLHGLSTGLTITFLFFWTNSNHMVLMFSVNHLTEPADFPDELTNERDWAKLQVLTSTNFGINSSLWTLLSGGLNYQIEHHLFPGVCHMYLPLIHPIVKKTCEEFKIPYSAFPSYFDALYSHYAHLRELGNPDLTRVPKPVAGACS